MPRLPSLARVALICTQLLKLTPLALREVLVAGKLDLRRRSPKVGAELVKVLGQLVVLVLEPLRSSRVREVVRGVVDQVG